MQCKHIKQKYSWDCGIACVCIIVSSISNLDDNKTVYKKFIPGTVWTIDLAYALKQGCLIIVDFYKKELEVDTPRINKLFESAGNEGIQIVQKSLNTEFIRECIQNGSSAIVLVDLRYLRTSVGASNTKSETEYMGHYIVVYDYQANTDEFVYSDPAEESADLLLISSSQLEIARRSTGTDEDILLISPK